jgi:Chromosome segregation protein Spc25
MILGIKECKVSIPHTSSPLPATGELVLTYRYSAEVAIEEEKQRQRAQRARALKAKVKEDKKTTVDDLTRGIINYKFTGLDFVKTNVENELLYVVAGMTCGRLLLVQFSSFELTMFFAIFSSRFTFTQLDQMDPTRKFSFLLQVDSSDKYQIAECMPALDAILLVEIADVLNETEDMSYLVRSMRK